MANRPTKRETVRDELLALIETSPPGSPIPSERELALRFGISRMTARQAVDLLVNAGTVVRRQGAGTFVAHRPFSLPLRLASFSADARSHGSVPGAIRVSQGLIEADAALASVLDVVPGEKIVSVVRVRTADGERLAVERAHFVARMVPGLESVDLEDTSLYEAIAAKYAISLETGEQRIQASACSQENARLLGVRPGAPMLHMTRTTSWRGIPCEFTASEYRGDRVELVTSLLPSRIASDV